MFVTNFRTITALVFSLLMLSTSLGAVVYQHFCGSSLKEVSLTKIEKHCKAHQTEGMCHHETEKEGCCKTERVIANRERAASRPMPLKKVIS